MDVPTHHAHKRSQCGNVANVANAGHYSHMDKQAGIFSDAASPQPITVVHSILLWEGRIIDTPTQTVHVLSFSCIPLTSPPSLPPSPSV